MTGYITEILGDDRIWETGLSEQALTGWPLMYEYANLAIVNATTNKTIEINTLNTRPFTGPNGTFPRIKIGRITAHSSGQDVTPFSFDSENATPVLEVKYRPSNVTDVANSFSMFQWVNTGMNLTRTQQWSRWQGGSCCNMDQTEVARWTDADTQKVTLRETEGLALYFDSDAGPNIFMVSVFVKDLATGATFLYNRMVEPLFMGGAPFISFLNPTGSGQIYQIGRIQAREVGSDEIPKIDYFKICSVDGAAADAQLVWADTNDAIDTGIIVKKNCFVTRDGMFRGAVITSPHFRYIMGGDFPYGPNIAGGANITRRGLYSHDFRFNDSRTHLHLGPGEGIAVVLRTASAMMYSEIIGNITVSAAASGTYPVEGNVRVTIAYGPTGVEYTGNMTLPSANDARVGVSYGTLGTEVTGTIALPAVADVKLGVSYGSNGPEATGTLAGGGGGGRHIVISGGWN